MVLMGVLSRLRRGTGDEGGHDHGAHHLVVVRIPADPGNPFGAMAWSGPVVGWLEQTGLGELLSAGAGAAHHKGPGGVPFIQLDLALHDVAPKALGRLVAELERLGAPAGSRLRTEHGEPVPFGL
ncbi:hypothetical protein [Nocardioides jiangxiensis]|uniref:Uncharacterized protein n=1 Tax=Nocardioides jiangxiensis TaxID=3064524 RepID=A0ABT9B6W8_9ACTN|nr:hypothetical protein [Nocardioides sp. WY-20]MDO7869056.1 hypothetical protein [Nocardioides sp. WY-20]